MRVAAVQCALSFVPDAEAFSRTVAEWAQQAAAAGAEVAVFPEDIGLPLVCLGDYDLASRARSIHGLALRLILRHWRFVLRGLTDPALSPRRAILVHKGPRMLQVYSDAFSAAARAARLTIVAGSLPALVPNDPCRRVYNTCYVFSPDGDTMGITRKVNLIDMEHRELDLSGAAPGQLPIYDLRGLRMGVAICRDTWYPELVAGLVARGARLIASPQANPFPWETEKAINRDGLFSRCQELGVFGVQAMAVGELAGVRFTGQSAVFGPRAMTPDESGVIAEAHSSSAEELVVADLDPGLLVTARQD